MSCCVHSALRRLLPLLAAALPFGCRDNAGREHNISANTDTAVREIRQLTLPGNHTVIAKVQVLHPVKTKAQYQVTGKGYIAADARRNRKIAVRVGGRVVKLYVKYNYQYVRKGQKIMDIESPELNTYIAEYMYVREHVDDTVLQHHAEQKLILLGLTPAMITQAVQNRLHAVTIPLYSPFEGYVLYNPSAEPANMENTGSAASAMGGMENTAVTQEPAPMSVLPDNSIREGMYVSKDQTLFWVNDFREVWGILAFTPGNGLYLKEGQPVTVQNEMDPDHPAKSTIQLAEQVYGEGQKFTQARIYLANSAGWKQHSLITATISVPVEALLVPQSSIYNLGRASIVWVQTGTTQEGSHVLQARAVRTGRKIGDQVEILEGLAANEKIARDAGFLADSETFISY